MSLHLQSEVQIKNGLRPTQGLIAQQTEEAPFEKADGEEVASPKFETGNDDYVDGTSE